jgi:NTE family protein
MALMEYRLGIVLSGGGTRGVAHAGVLKALTEHGIRPDCLAGTSSGAIVGALYAAGYTADETLEFFKKKNPFKLSKLAVGKPGWIDTAKVAADFREYFPEDRFESLQRKLFVTATDLVNGELTIFDSGPLIAAVIASCSVPVVFTPTPIDGRWYSDGGITNNFPVEPLKTRCEKVVGIYASPVTAADHSQLSSSVAVWQRALEVGMYSAARAKFDLCDFVLCPEALRGFGLFDTKHIEAIFEIGYEAALARMKSIKRALTRRRDVASDPPAGDPPAEPGPAGGSPVTRSSAPRIQP